MSALFDLRALASAVAVPFKFVFAGTREEETRRTSRPPLIQRWQKGEDGRLRSKWERDGK